MPTTIAPAYPPYGLLNEDLMGAIAAYPFPEGFTPPAGKTPLQAWREVYDALVDQFALTLWPRWRSSGSGAPTWDGAAASAMHALTVADFAVMDSLGTAQVIDQPVEQRAPGGPPLATPATHRYFFRIEDDSGLPVPVMDYLPMSDRLALDREGAAAGLKSFRQRAEHWMVAHCTAATLPSKLEIQRPRPYQIASLLGRPHPHLFAEGAVTSALPSGHAIQGLQGICAAYLEYMRLPSMTSAARTRVQQYAVDMGDRRVMAGVHYPSDNLASWCMALFLCDVLYGPHAAHGRTFLVEAIIQHSLVYHAIVASADPAYGTALAWFRKLAGIRGADESVAQATAKM